MFPGSHDMQDNDTQVPFLLSTQYDTAYPNVPENEKARPDGQAFSRKSITSRRLGSNGQRLVHPPLVPWVPRSFTAIWGARAEIVAFCSSLARQLQPETRAVFVDFPPIGGMSAANTVGRSRFDCLNMVTSPSLTFSECPPTPTSAPASSPLYVNASRLPFTHERCQRTGCAINSIPTRCYAIASCKGRLWCVLLWLQHSGRVTQLGVAQGAPGGWGGGGATSNA